MAKLETKFHGVPLNAYTFEFYDDSGNVTGKDKIERASLGYIRDICARYCRKGQKFKLYVHSGAFSHLRYIASNMEGA